MPAERAGLQRALLLSLAALLVVLVAWRGWVGDDAFLTFRVLDNFAQGHGLVWNAGERVQAYTHALWMLALLLLQGVTGELFLTSLALSLACTAAAAYLLGFRVARSAASGALALSLLLFSRAFVDYSTSGLENPLSHLLVIGFALVLPRSGDRAAHVGLLAGLTCLAALNRLDLIWLLGPGLLMSLGWPLRARRLAALALGFAPLAAWLAFSLVYYGAPLPNSALAKLSTGLGVGDLAPRGLGYLWSSLRFDPLSGLILGAGLAAGLAARDGSQRALAAGVVLSLLYVVGVGGDFMSGRFLTPALAACVCLIARAPLREKLAWSAAAGVSLVSLLVPWTSPFVEREYGELWYAAIDDAGVADERSFHREVGSLRAAWADPQLVAPRDPVRLELARLRWWADPLLPAFARWDLLREREGWPPADARAAGGQRPLLLKGGVGLLGYQMGPDVHVLDYHGLGDPLLARLPCQGRDPLLAELVPPLAPLGWRTGHYLRAIPAGYAESLSRGRNLVLDPGLAALVDDLALATRAALLEPGRAAAIWRLHSGAHAEAIAAYARRRGAVGAAR